MLLKHPPPARARFFRTEEVQKRCINILHGMTSPGTQTKATQQQKTGHFKSKKRVRYAVKPSFTPLLTPSLFLGDYRKLTVGLRQATPRASEREKYSPEVASRHPRVIIASLDVVALCIRVQKSYAAKIREDKTSTQKLHLL